MGRRRHDQLTILPLSAPAYIVKS